MQADQSVGGSALAVGAVELCDQLGEAVGDRLLRDRVVHRAQLRGDAIAGLIAQAVPAPGAVGLVGSGCVTGAVLGRR